MLQSWGPACRGQVGVLALSGVTLSPGSLQGRPLLVSSIYMGERKTTGMYQHPSPSAHVWLKSLSKVSTPFRPPRLIDDKSHEQESSFSPGDTWGPESILGSEGRVLESCILGTSVGKQVNRWAWRAEPEQSKTREKNQYPKPIRHISAGTLCLYWP